jgi:hypothetical protein
LWILLIAEESSFLKPGTAANLMGSFGELTLFKNLDYAASYFQKLDFILIEAVNINIIRQGKL